MTQTSKKSAHHELRNIFFRTHDGEKPDSRKQTVEVRSGNGEQQQAKPKGQINGRPIDTRQKVAEISMKLQKHVKNELRAILLLLYIHTCEVYCKHYYPL
jgi:hypothetical protein